MQRRPTRREHNRAAALLAGSIALGATAAPAGAAPALAPVGDFDSPTYLTAPRGDSRVFVVERAGIVRVLREGRAEPAPFLDIRSAVNTSGAEQGMLSLAFPFDYARSGRFYVSFTDGDGRIVIAEYRRSESDPDRADPRSRRDVLVVPHPTYPNNNGGQLQFGPDGFLYLATGDGGGSGDPTNNAQNLVSGLGKLLRFDPRRPTADGSGGGLPADNPYAGAAGYAPLVWASGLRNPRRFSFDAVTGDLIVGDAGQTRADEIDFVPSGAGRGRGANFGWRCFEGGERTPGDGGPLCSDGDVGLVRSAGGRPPVVPAVSIPRGSGGCAIVGGYVVRDAGVPSLGGRYVYGDACSPALASVALGQDQPRIEPLRVARLASLGQDACLRVYAISSQGAIQRLVEAGRPATPCTLPAAPGEDGGARTRGPRVSVRFGSTRGLLRSSRRMRMQVRCDRPCSLRARPASLGRGYTSHCTLRSSRARLMLPLKITARQRATLLRRLRRSRSTLVRVRFVATDRRTGARRTSYKRLRVRR